KFDRKPVAPPAGAPDTSPETTLALARTFQVRAAGDRVLRLGQGASPPAPQFPVNHLMESGSVAPEGARWRLWALVPILLMVGAVSLFAASGRSLVDLVGQNPPPLDELDIRRVTFQPGEIRIRVTNPQRD